jgi:hypothetical protein
MNEEIDKNKDILLIEHHWELVVIIHSYNLKGNDGQLPIYCDIYQKVGQKPNCPCNKNNIAFLDNIKDNLDKFLLPDEILKIKKEEQAKIIHLKKKDGSILEF